MGGYGSGRWGWYTKRDTVDDCRSLDVNKLIRDKLLSAGRWRRGTLTWTNTTTGEKVSCLEYELKTLDTDAAFMRLQYRFKDSDDILDYSVRLTTTPLPWGGVRWWFICPLVVSGHACGRRVGKLHLPPRGRHYGCRHCYDLTYRSCQESQKYTGGLWRALAVNMGITPTELRRIMKEEARSTRGRRPRRKRAANRRVSARA